MTLAALACLGVAIVTGGMAVARQTRRPTAAERAAAAAAAVARRWRTWPVGKVFPATLGYTTALLSKEQADRNGISPGHGCARALEGNALTAARRDGCEGAVRATYAGGLNGIVYTAGVLAFPRPSRASAFAHTVAGDSLPSGLRAFALAGTASARFTDAAREIAVSRQSGPYVVLIVAGYADGRPASATRQHRPAVFAPAHQLAEDIMAPLVRPTVVRCGTPEWTC